jgi:hypothetical protein
MTKFIIDNSFIGTIKGLSGSEIKLLCYMITVEDSLTGEVHLPLYIIRGYSKAVKTSAESTYNALKSLATKRVILKLGFGHYSIQHNLIKLTEAK